MATCVYMHMFVCTTFSYQNVVLLQFVSNTCHCMYVVCGVCVCACVCVSTPPHGYVGVQAYVCV